MVIPKITPDLRFKYVNGLGDLVAAILHCRLFGWLTYLITKKDKPCSVCSMRRSAMNFLVPCPLWKLFFKNREELVETMAAEYRALGYRVEINKENGNLDIFKGEEYFI